MTKNEFYKVFDKLRVDFIPTQRGNIVNAFLHCGLFPLQNPTSREDFNLSDNFRNSAKKFERTCDDEVLLKKLHPDPQKDPSVVHHTERPALITTPEILNAKKQRACPGSSSQVDKSKFLKGLEKKPKRKFKKVDKENDQVQSICANCYVEFESGKNGDFIKCRICQLWVCENFYGSEGCVNCG